MRVIKFIFSGIIGGFILLFLFQNHEELSREVTFEFNLYFTKYRLIPIPLGAYLILFFILGYILSVILLFREKIKVMMEKRKNYRVKKEEIQRDGETELHPFTGGKKFNG